MPAQRTSCLLLTGASVALLALQWLSSRTPAHFPFAQLRHGMTRAEAEALGQGATLGGYPAKVTYGFSSDEKLENFGVSVFRREARCATAFKALHDEAVSVLGAPTSTNRLVEGKQCEDWTLSDSAIRICCRQASPVDGGTGWMLLMAIKSFSPHEKIDIRNGFH